MLRLADVLSLVVERNDFEEVAGKKILLRWRLHIGNCAPSHKFPIHNTRTLFFGGTEGIRYSPRQPLSSPIFRRPRHSRTTNLVEKGLSLRAEESAPRHPSLRFLKTSHFRLQPIPIRINCENSIYEPPAHYPPLCSEGRVSNL